MKFHFVPLSITGVRSGTIDGFVDTGYERKPQIANHATVWMLKGVHENWEQPILYSFCNGTAKWEDLVHTFKDIVKECNKFGIKIVASVCDQGATNVSAIKNLIEASKREAFRNGETLRHDVIVIDGQVIVPLFDPPHLMKCLRNNLLTKNLKFTLNDGIERVAKWSHIETAYKNDKSCGSLRLMPKLTDLHVDKNRIKKMKVKYCTQVFSRTVAVGIAAMSRYSAKSADSQLSMPSAGEETAKFIEFANNLFDSVNERLPNQTANSTAALDKDWDEYIRVIKSMKYVKSKPGDRETLIVLDNVIRTLQGFKYLKKYLAELGIEHFVTRVFNQDALENFFGQIKQHGIRDTRPNCSRFKDHYKTLLLQNFS